MTPELIGAYAAAGVAIIGAVAGLIRQIQHQNSAAHQEDKGNSSS